MVQVWFAFVRLDGFRDAEVAVDPCAHQMSAETSLIPCRVQVEMYVRDEYDQERAERRAALHSLQLILLSRCAVSSNAEPRSESLPDQHPFCVVSRMDPIAEEPAVNSWKKHVRAAVGASSSRRKGRR